MRSLQSAGVPGSAAGMIYALEKYGTMSRKQVVAPAVNLARRGFELDLDTARSFKRRLEQFSKYEASAAASKSLHLATNSSGAPPDISVPSIRPGDTQFTVISGASAADRKRVSGTTDPLLGE